MYKFRCNVAQYSVVLGKKTEQTIERQLQEAQLPEALCCYDGEYHHVII